MEEKRHTNWRSHLANIGLLALVIAALYWRVFFLGETIIDVDTLNNQLPWGHAANDNVQHPYNRRDPTDMYLTREYFIAQAYADGELPLWNPYNMAGHPIYADGVTRIFSPFLLFYTFLDLPLGYSVARIVELLLGAIFMYLFLITIGVSPRAALSGALVFELSAHSLFHLTGLGWWGGLLWLPLILLFVERSITRNSFTQAILAGIIIALQFFCAYMPNQIYYVGAVVLYYLLYGLRVKGLVSRSGSGSLNAFRLFAMLAVALAVGLTLSATQWVPVMELLGFSNRRIVPTETSFIYLPPWYLATLIFPNLFGTAYDPKMVTLFAGLNVSHDHSLYLSIAALLPLGFLIYSQRSRLKARFGRLRAGKLFRVKSPDPAGDSGGPSHNESPGTSPLPSVGELVRQRRQEFFILLLLVSLFVMMAAPLYVHLTQFIPVLRSIRVIVRAGVLFQFAVSVLLGFGAEALLKAATEELQGFHRYVKRLFYAVLAMVGVAAVVSFLLRFSGLLAGASGEYTAGSGRLAYLRNVAAAMTAQFTQPRASILLPLAFLSMAYLLWQQFHRKRINREWFFALLVVLLVVDLSVNSLQYDETHDRRRVFPATAITDRLKQLPPGRVLVAPSGIETNRKARNPELEEKIIAPPNTLLPYQISVVTGKDQLFPKAYREFCALIEPQKNLSHVVFEGHESPYFDLLNVRYLMTHEAAAVSPGYELLMKADAIALYENRNAMPRAFFVRQMTALGSLEGADGTKRIGQPGFDVRTEAVVSGARVEAQSFAVGKASIIEDRRNRVVVETENPGDGWLVLSDNFYPGWQATIDGRPAEIYRANHTMRAVQVPAGSHVLSFSFAPQVLRRSVLVSLAGAVLVLAAVILLQVKRRREV
jgi:hypothetical protein